jgi:hypothetical protein
MLILGLRPSNSFFWEYLFRIFGIVFFAEWRRGILAAGKCETNCLGRQKNRLQNTEIENYRHFSEADGDVAQLYCYIMVIKKYVSDLSENNMLPV